MNVGNIAKFMFSLAVSGAPSDRYPRPENNYDLPKVPSAYRNHRSQSVNPNFCYRLLCPPRLYIELYRTSGPSSVETRPATSLRGSS